jgi:electron transport complex protein RnfG
MIKSSILRNGGLLTVFAVITTAIVAATHLLTKNKIADQIQQQRIAILNTVVPPDMYDGDFLASCRKVNAKVLGGENLLYIAYDMGRPNAYAIETTAKNGYSGDIDLIMGVKIDSDSDATVLGVRVLKHKETPGLGDKIELSVSNWILAFNNKSYNENTRSTWKVKKDGGQFDQFTGATITPRAVVYSLADTLQWLIDNQSSLLQISSACKDENDR